MHTTKMFFVMGYQLFLSPSVCMDDPNSKVFSEYMKFFQQEVDFNFDYVLSGKFSGNTWTGRLQTGDLRTGPPIRITYINLPDSENNGSVSHSEYKTSLDKVLHRIEEGLPIFAVIDHNSAHHISYILARKAFSTLSTDAADRKKVVINFDNHGDGQNSSPDRIRCGDWAYHLFLKHGDDPAVNPVYISVGAYQQRLFAQGVTGKTPEGKELIQKWADGKTCVYYGSERKTFMTDSLDETSISVILEKVSSWVGINWSESDVYITVDRDFMIGSYTSYGDGKISPENGRDVVELCLYYLQENGSKLVGFDVIGLPVMGGKETSQEFVEITSQIEKLEHDIEKLTDPTQLEVKKKEKDQLVKQFVEKINKNQNEAIKRSIKDIHDFYDWISQYQESSIAVTVSGTVSRGGK